MTEDKREIDDMSSNGSLKKYQDEISEHLFETKGTAKECEEIVDDEWAEFRKLSPEEQKWALIQLQLDREQRYIEGLYSQE